MSKDGPSGNIIERYGLRYFERLSRDLPNREDEDGVHILNAAERKALKRIQRGAILRQSLAGGLSAGISTALALWLWPFPGNRDAELSWDMALWYYGWVYGLTLVVTALEIGYLYRDALRSVHRLSVTAGLRLFSEEDSASGVALALVRAALELPNPPDRLEGVDPRREVSRWRVLAATLVYKAKATATNFLLKAVIRRLAGRAGFRAWMEFVAVPVYAFWNGLIAWWVLRQARIRAMGPSAVKEFVQLVLENSLALSPEGHLAVFQAVGVSIVRTVDLHPNLVAFVKALENRLGEPPEGKLDDTDLFLEQLSQLDHPEQDMVLKVLALSCVLDGKLARREKALAKRALSITGYRPDLQGLEALARSFRRGDPITHAELVACLPVKNQESQPVPVA